MTRTGTSASAGAPERSAPFLPTAPPGLSNRSDSRSWSVQRRRSLPRVLLGLALVVGCALAFGVVAMRGQAGRQVLMLARGVQAGQVLVAEDLTTLRVSTNASAVVPASQLPQWVGHTLTSPLPAGQLLSPANLGPSTWPPAGKSVVAVPVPPGRIPAGVQPGSSVRVVVSSSAVGAATSTGTVGGTGVVPATVVEVQLPGTSTAVVGTGRSASTSSGAGSDTVLSLLVNSGDAVAVAAADENYLAVVLQGN